MDITPDTWRWIWLVIAAVLITGEMFVAGTFILIPFGLSAAVAMVLAFFGAPLIIDWIVFVGLGGALFSIFWRTVSQIRKIFSLKPSATQGKSSLKISTRWGLAFRRS